ncbi:MAG TPA: DNA repair protein RadA [bacterium]
MPKLKTSHVCQQCGYQSPKWLGRCPECGTWNSLVEEITEEAPSARLRETERALTTRLGEVELEDVPRLATGVEEFDRVLGGGLVPGSVVLVGGEPGIGKSTLLLTVAGAVARRAGVLYVSGEESPRQTKLRAVRLGLEQSAVELLAETRLESVLDALERLKPPLAVIDSIQVMETQTLESAPGSIGQVRACAHELVRFAKATGCAVVLVGHVTKDGSLAGPKVLEHLVDAVFSFEGDPTSGFRLLRAAKNRFGATNELGVFHMTAEGLEGVANPSELFLSGQAGGGAAGCMVAVTLEGTRPLLGEVQALTSPCGLGLPRRRTTGLDVNRVSMLLAVLERRAGLKQLAQQDVFVSSLGGLSMLEPGADLATAIAIASSLNDRPTRRTDAAIGEVGLTGEVRPVSQMRERLREARRMGFRRCLLGAGRGVPEAIAGMELMTVRHLHEAVGLALAAESA